MKKYLKAELVSLAHKILQLDDDVAYDELAIKARELQDRFTILSYVEKFENEPKTKISLKEVEEKMATTTNKTEKSPIQNQNNKERSEIKEPQNEGIAAPIAISHKSILQEKEIESQANNLVIEDLIPKQPNVGKNDSFEIGNEYRQTPIFEPKDDSAAEASDGKPKKLNQALNKGKFKIGLNDKLSFIKHLFNSSPSDYNRVLSQLETFQTSSEAQDFINQMIKPDYNNWEGKEVQEQRFMEIIEGRYA